MHSNPLSHLRPAALERFYYGAAYYPEHWDDATRAEDVNRMKAAGFNCVRMAEFAWSLMEPRRGEFHFALFDRAIEELGAQGIQTLLCTPTAAPPRWLSARHPEILRMDANGQPFQHGSRVHANYASPVYRDYSQKITQAMAGHFRDNPHVVGWQTDNEFMAFEDHSEAMRRAFVEFLRNKFEHDIEALNTAWGTSFWAQTYSNFKEIQTPLGRPAGRNPAHTLDYFRCLSRVIAEFQAEQVEILRSTNPKWWLTHNGCFPRIDYREIGQPLDVLSYDSYPFFENDPEKRASSHAFNLDRTRAWTGNFLVLEQQSGPGGTAGYLHDNPEPGEMRRMTYSSIAHGADGIFFFRWRTCRFGQEEYWCGILDHDNIPRRRYDEAVQLGEEFQRVGKAVMGTSVYVEAGIAASDHDVNNADEAYSLGLPSPAKMAEPAHQWLFQRGYAVGCVHPADDIASLKLLIIPHWAVFHPAWVANLEQFVRKGGTLVIGARTGTRDWNNNVVSETPPGVLRKLAGVHVQEYGRRNAPEKRPLFLQLGSQRVSCDLWYEALGADSDVDVLASWEGRHLTSQAAITRRNLGEGQVIYVGSYLTEELVAAQLPELVQASELQPLLPDLPAGIEIQLRENHARKLWFLINHSEDPVHLHQAPEGLDLVTNEAVTGTITLQANAVAVVQQLTRH